MATPYNSKKKDNPSTYFVQDRQNKEELARLTVQDRMMTMGMGGVLPEQSDPTRFQHVLDIGCGPGSWPIQLIQAYPAMSVVGIDISQRMIDFACAQATSLQLEEHLTFQVMDALQILEFVDGAFDLVNLRLGTSYVRTWDWPRLIGEMLRVTRPGGVIRLTEAEVVIDSNSAALTRVFEMLLCSLFRAGHLYEQASNGLTSHLEQLLTQYGCTSVQTKAYLLLYPEDAERRKAFYENTMYGVRTLRPFLEKWGCADESYDELCREALSDIQRSDFQSTNHVLTVWGMKRLK